MSTRVTCLSQAGRLRAGALACGNAPLDQLAEDDWVLVSDQGQGTGTMLVVRCTAKLLRRLNTEPDQASAPSTTRLGEWYATVLPTRPQHLVLLVNEPTRLAAVLPAREISTLAKRIPDAVAQVLLELGVAQGVIEDERSAMDEIAFAKTANRSVLGTINDFVVQMGVRLAASPNMAPHELAMELNDTPVSPLVYDRPADVARRAFDAPSSQAPRSIPAIREGTRMKAGARSIYELKIALQDSRPPIWRRVRVRSDITLFKFHGIVQTVMGWIDCHLHQFVAQDKVYGALDAEFPERENEKKVLLSMVLRKPKDSLVYEYDFGDGWEHGVVLEQVLEAEPGCKYPYVVAGQRACPPEDCGGTGGYARLLEVLADDKASGARGDGRVGGRII